MPIDRLPRDVERVVFQLCEDSDTPRALTVVILLRCGEWDQLALLRCDPGHYLTAESYYRDVVVTDLLRKLEDLPTSWDRREAALDTFWECERKCYETNERLSRYLDRGQLDSGNVVERCILSARKMIGDLLRNPPDLLDGRFGPGATYSDKSQLSTIPDKMTSIPVLTSGAIPFLFQWGSTAWAKACASDRASIEFVRGNRFTAVPKDCTKFRGIAIEPSINVFYQLALGRVMKKQLSAAGLDLQHAQITHRRVACEASISGRFVTIDLSNASDTVSRNLVKLLLPHSWHDCLDMLRSPTTEVEGKRVRLEKFSSMGNGYTFELETCLFLGICSAVMAELGHKPLPGVNVFVYGDDIIVPTEVGREVIAALRFFGFSENAKKTFLEGPFRESCGGDYFEGVDVRPHYLKEIPREPSEWIALANGLYRLGRCDLNGHFTHRFIVRARLRVFDAIPTNVRRCRGPQALGDICIHEHSDERWNYRVRSSIRYIRCWRPLRPKKVSWDHFKPDVVLASALYGVGSGTQDAPIGFRSVNCGGISPRNAVAGFKEGWVSYS